MSLLEEFLKLLKRELMWKAKSTSVKIDFGYFPNEYLFREAEVILLNASLMVFFFSIYLCT